MQRFNNWMSFSYNGVEYEKKTKYDDVLTINFNKKIFKSTISYKDALLNNAKLMRDSYTEPFDVCLSGGIDSEVVVRTFKEAGIKHNTFIFKLENDYNVRDVEGAISICKNLSLPYHIIDFNLQQFFENEAFALHSKTFVPYAGRLPRLKFLDYLDNIPIFCDGEPYWKRHESSNYSIKSKWHFQLNEDAYAVSIYSKAIDRIVIGDWYEFTPDVIMTYKTLSFVRKLLNDEIQGKTSNLTSKILIHQEIWPDIKDRIKLIGYEGRDGLQGNRPRFMDVFYYQYMSKIKNTIFSFTEEELDNLIFD